MGKISQVAAKYIVQTSIQIEGVVERPDVIGAIFGQTEGLLGSDLELRELQRSGRIGRIEVNTEIKNGKTEGNIIIPSSLDKEETVIVAAALETIQRIGPCNAKVKVEKIEDVRVAKRNYVIERAKELLRKLMNEVLPDSSEMMEEVASSVRMMSVVEYGKDRLPAGPSVDESEEVIVVEGRADVLNLLKHGFKNVVALNGTGVPETIKELSKGKTITLFVDGDRGGDLIIKEVMEVCEVDFIIKAPDGKEVEEITMKEIHKALRSKVAAEQVRMEIKDLPKRSDMIRQMNKTYHTPSAVPTQSVPIRSAMPIRGPMPARPMMRPVSAPVVKKPGSEHKEKFKQLLEDLVGTRGAYILDEKMSILGKVPSSELVSTLKSLSNGVFAAVFDGSITKDLVMAAEKAGIQYLVAMDSSVRQNETRVNLLTQTELQVVQ